MRIVHEHSTPYMKYNNNTINWFVKHKVYSIDYNNNNSYYSLKSIIQIIIWYDI